MTTTPNPLAGLFGGAQQQSLPLQPGAGPVVPGGTPAPDPNAAAQQALGMSKEQMALLNQALQQAATPRFGGGQQPAVPGQQQPMSPTPPGYMQQRPWGPERFMYQLQSSISEISSALEERKTRQAENMYTNVITASQKYMKPDGSFDAKAAAQDPYLSTLKDSDYKKMANTLQESWLNPKSTTPHKEGLKQAQQKFDAQQQQRGKLDKFVQGLIHKATAPLRGGPQLTPEQQQAQTAQILGRAPLGPAGGTVQDATAIGKTTLELAQAQKALQEKYIAVTNYRDGSAYMVNPADPRDKIELTDKNDLPFEGKPLAKQGQPAFFPGTHRLAGIWNNGQLVGVNSPAFASIPGALDLKKSADDQFAWLQEMRIPPQYAALVGDPPIPSNYEGGTENPQYRKKFAAYGETIRDAMLADKTQIAMTYGKARAMWQPRDVLTHDPITGAPITKLVYGKDAIGLSSAPEGIQLLPRMQQIQDIEYSSDKLREAINNPNLEAFTTGQRAKLTLALKTSDGAAASDAIEAVASEKLTPEQMKFVDWVKAINERAMSLRSIAGQGVGAQDLRDAIRGLLPGVGSGNRQRMNDQLDIFDNQVQILKRGIPSPGGFEGQRDTRGTERPAATQAPAAGGARPGETPVVVDGKIVGYTKPGQKGMRPVSGQ